MPNRSEKEFPANTNLLDVVSTEDVATMYHMHAANKLRLTLRPPANTDMSRGDILPLVHLVYGNLSYYNYFIFNCHFKFNGMQCNVYVYRIREIKIYSLYFTCYFCRYFRFNLKNVGMGHAKKCQNVIFTMFKMHISSKIHKSSAIFFFLRL